MHFFVMTEPKNNNFHFEPDQHLKMFNTSTFYNKLLFFSSIILFCRKFKQKPNILSGIKGLLIGKSEKVSRDVRTMV